MNVQGRGWRTRTRSRSSGKEKKEQDEQQKKEPEEEDGEEQRRRRKKRKGNREDEAWPKGRERKRKAENETRIASCQPSQRHHQESASGSLAGRSFDLTLSISEQPPSLPSKLQHLPRQSKDCHLRSFPMLFMSNGSKDAAFTECISQQSSIDPVSSPFRDLGSGEEDQGSATMEEEQQSMLYSCVARGTVVLVEHKEREGPFIDLVKRCLQKLRSDNNRVTYTSGKYTLNFLLENGFVYVLVADESLGREITFTYLELVRDDFTQCFGGGKADTGTPYSFEIEFRVKLKQHMNYCLANPEEMDKLVKVKAKVSEVKGIMMENMEKVFDRGEDIQVLIGKSYALKDQAQKFKSTCSTLKWKIWLQNMKIKLIVLAIVIALALILYLSICHGRKCL